MSDIMAEMVTGEPGTVRAFGRFVVARKGLTQDDGELVMFAGSLFAEHGPNNGKMVLPENEGKLELWECELLIIPTKKYSALREDGTYAQTGRRIDQILCSSALDNPERCWGRQYFIKEQSK